MGLVRTALIFGAGYALGSPEGRRRVAELSRRPEVDRLRRQAVDTVSTQVEAGRKRLTGAVDSTADSTAGTAGDTAAEASAQRRRRLPSFPRRGAPLATPSATVPPAGATGAAGAAGAASAAVDADRPDTAPPATSP